MCDVSGLEIPPSFLYAVQPEGEQRAIMVRTIDRKLTYLHATDKQQVPPQTRRCLYRSRQGGHVCCARRAWLPLSRCTVRSASLSTLPPPPFFSLNDNVRNDVVEVEIVKLSWIFRSSRLALFGAELADEFFSNVSENLVR